MIQLLLSVLVFLPAFLVGLKVIPLYWLLITAVAVYIKSIYTVSQAVPGGDFRELNSDEFQSKDKAIKIMAVGLCVLSALAYGLGLLVDWLFN